MSTEAPTLDAAYSYPIKGCGAIEISEPGALVEVGNYGLLYDRQFAVVDTVGEPLTARTHPDLVTIKPQIEHGKLTIDSRLGSLVISLGYNGSTEPVPVSLWGRSGTATVESALANDYFSEFVGRAVRLVRIEQPRPAKLGGLSMYSQYTAFADSSPILLTTRESLAQLNEDPRLSDQPADMGRFRPNLVVAGVEKPYDEDEWQEILIGRGLAASVIGACGRCIVPNIDPETGELPRDRPVNKVLHSERRGVNDNGETGVFFGLNLAYTYEQNSIIRIGDLVNVVGRADRPNWTPAGR